MTLRATLKTVLGTGLWPISQAVLHGMHGEKGLILMFHYVRPPILDGVSTSLFVSQGAFGEMLDLLVRSFKVLEPVEFFERMQAGDLPPRATLLTFDDGGVDNVVNALPELQKRDLKAAFFVCPGLIDNGAVPPTMQLAKLLAQAKAGKYELSFNPQFSKGVELPARITFDDHAGRVDAFFRIHPAIREMHSLDHPSFFKYLAELFDFNEDTDATDFRLASWEELQQLADAGMYVGNHTMSHSTIDADGADNFRHEVGTAYEQLERFQMGGPKIFCFPYGREADVTPEAIRILREQNVDFALATQGGIASPQISSPWALRRESVFHSAAHLKLRPLLASLRK